MKMLRYRVKIQQLRSFGSVFSIGAEYRPVQWSDNRSRPSKGSRRMDSDAPNRPRGFAAIGAFFVFGATMAAYAAVTLLMPGTFLDALWVLNKRGHAGLILLGRGAVFPFAALSVLLGLAALGWFRRKRWGWMLGVTIIALHAAGDLINGVMGEWLKGAFGVAIAGLLLIYMTRGRVRSHFRREGAARQI
jgi:hypothetical protein